MDFYSSVQLDFTINLLFLDSSAFCFTASRILNGVKISVTIIYLFIR